MLISIVYTTSRLGRFMLGMRFMRGFIYKLSGYGVCTREVMSVRKRRRYSYVTEDQIRTAAQDLEKKLHADDFRSRDEGSESMGDGAGNQDSIFSVCRFE